MIISILISLSITILISLGVGFTLSNIFDFWQGVVGATVVQFIVFYLVAERKNNTVVQNTYNAINNEIIDLQTVPVSCPCGKNTFEATIFFNVDNTFKCEKCNSRFKVETDYNSILVTDPLNVENAFNHLKDKGTVIS